MIPTIAQAKSSVQPLSHALAALCLLFVAAGQVAAVEKSSLEMDPTIGQAVFASPQLAAQALNDAFEARDREALAAMFGPRSADLVPMDGIDDEDIDKFVSIYAGSHALIAEGAQQFVLTLGEKNWTFPVPIVQGDRGWHFDTATGVERVLTRQIGRNELGTIQAALAYYDAQLEYAQQDRNADGILEYAQKFISAAGQRDGLYWETKSGEQLSPLGPLFADQELPEGSYHGYHFRILKSQGTNAPGGAYDYMVGGRMIGGFALFAWPAIHGETGVMSFMVSHYGVVYEKNLGPEGAAAAMQQFDPGAGWMPTNEAQYVEANTRSD